MNNDIENVHRITLAASIPFPNRWLDAEGIGAMLGYTPAIVLRQIACLPSFPKPMRLGGNGRPRWKASEVADWADRQRDAA